MVLYDKNHKFIGISSKTLSYLGYEDIKEFSSVHSDFANILVNQEGYIYNFSNFSWIDFILYSGSPNKSALATLKNGREVEVKLSIEEIYLPQEINGNSSFFAVHVTGEVDVGEESYEHTAPKGIFNLDNLMPTTDKENNKLEPQRIEDPKPIETLNNNDYKLDIPQPIQTNEFENREFILDSSFEEQVNPTPQPKEETKKEDIPTNFVEPIIGKEIQLETKVEDKRSEKDDFQLNFLKTEKQELPTSEPKDKIITPIEEEKKSTKDDFQFNFLKPEKQEKPILEPKEETEELSLNFLKPTTQKETQPEPKIEEVKNSEDDLQLNFLKTEKQEEPKVEVKEEIVTPIEEKSTKDDFQLNFLKTEEEKTITPPKDEVVVQKKEEEKAEELSLNFLKPENEEKIPSKPKEEDKKSGEDDFQLNILKTDKQGESISQQKVEIANPTEEQSVEDDFQLNFLKTDKQEEIVNTIKKEEKKEELSLNFLKPTTEKEIQTEPKIEEKKGIKEEEDFQFNFLETEKQEEPITQEKEEIIDPKVEEKSIEEEEDFRLNFLRSNPYKEDSEDIKEDTLTPKSEESKEGMVQFNFLQNLNTETEEQTIDTDQKEQLINQIKNDIKEIDTKEDPIKEDSQTGLKSLSSSLKSIFSRGEKENKKEETTANFSLKSEQKNINQQNRDSLEDTSINIMNQPLEEIESNLNLDLNEPLIQESSELATVKKSKPKIEIQPQNISVELQNLGLTQEDEYDLINDFVNDISVHLNLFNKLIANKNFDQAQYSLIKVKSSAEILNLDAIIISLNGIKEACDRKDEQNIKELNLHLENQVQQLRDYLKNATI